MSAAVHASLKAEEHMTTTTVCLSGTCVHCLARVWLRRTMHWIVADFTKQARSMLQTLAGSSPGSPWPPKTTIWFPTSVAV